MRNPMDASTSVSITLGCGRVTGGPRLEILPNKGDWLTIFTFGPRLVGFVLIVLSLVVCPMAGRSAAQQTTEYTTAEAEAVSFLRGLDQGDLADVYKLHAGPTLIAGLTQERFVQQIGISRIQSGGPAKSRVLVGGQQFSQTPTGQQGVFYYFRYRTNFPSGTSIFQDVYLEKVAAEWKISGIWIVPAPQNPGVQ